MYKNLQNAINSLPFNEVIELLNNYQKETGIDVSTTKSKPITENFQDKLIRNGINSVCPHCSSEKVVGYGYNGNVKRFKCKNCGKLFTLFTNTILEKTKYSWDIWVKVLELVFNHTELKSIHHILVDDFGLKDLDYKTVFLWVHKWIHAMAEMPMPKLSGTIQVDETFFRETQKGSRKLVSTLSNEKRWPRYGRVPSKLGVMGNEYFKFDEEDNVISFNKKEFLYSLPKYRLDKLRKKFKLPKSWAKDPVITALLKEETIEQDIFLLMNEYKFKQIEDEDNEGIKARDYVIKMRA